MKLVAVGKHEVVVLRLGEEVFALRNTCPHAAAKICLGRVNPLIVADRPGPGAAEVQVERSVITCPWHGWEFDPRDGQAIADPRMRLKVWAAKVEDDHVLVEV
jgi:3-phenylpropionate/trans-cinnamate dioxygenase ferredoxin subunit